MEIAHFLILITISSFKNQFFTPWDLKLDSLPLISHVQQIIVLSRGKPRLFSRGKLHFGFTEKKDKVLPRPEGSILSGGTVYQEKWILQSLDFTFKI